PECRSKPGILECPRPFPQIQHAVRGGAAHPQRSVGPDEESVGRPAWILPLQSHVMPSPTVEARKAAHDGSPDDTIVILCQCANVADRQSVFSTIVLNAAVRSDIAHASAAVADPESAVARCQQRVNVGCRQPSLVGHEPLELDTVEPKQAVR